VSCTEFVVTDDVTRVILRGGTSGGYINANYVNMEIPGSGIINRYIATQGMQYHADILFTQHMILCNTYTVYIEHVVLYSITYSVHTICDIV
jgi:protein tyrosine phosphatase